MLAAEVKTMLGIAMPPAIPVGGGGVAETIAAIATSVLLLIGTVTWIWVMARRNPTGTTTIELPTRTTKARAA